MTLRFSKVRIRYSTAIPEPEEPLVLLSQYLAARPTKPERRLMAAVLARAVDDCHFAARHPHSCEARALVREVAAWFFEDDPCTAWPYTFRAICEELQISVDRTRRELRASLPSLALVDGIPPGARFGTVVEATRMAAVRH